MKFVILSLLDSIKFDEDEDEDKTRKKEEKIALVHLISSFANQIKTKTKSSDVIARCLYLLSFTSSIFLRWIYSLFQSFSLKKNWNYCHCPYLLINLIKLIYSMFYLRKSNYCEWYSAKIYYEKRWSFQLFPLSLTKSIGRRIFRRIVNICIDDIHMFRIDEHQWIVLDYVALCCRLVSIVIINK